MAVSEVNYFESGGGGSLKCTRYTVNSSGMKDKDGNTVSQITFSKDTQAIFLSYRSDYQVFTLNGSSVSKTAVPNANYCAITDILDISAGSILTVSSSTSTAYDFYVIELD